MQNIQVTLKTTDFCGDHSRDISVAISVSENTTIKDLMSDVFSLNKYGISASSKTDHVEIRLENSVDDEKLFKIKIEEEKPFKIEIEEENPF